MQSPVYTTGAAEPGHKNFSIDLVAMCVTIQLSNHVRISSNIAAARRYRRFRKMSLVDLLVVEFFLRFIQTRP